MAHLKDITNQPKIQTFPGATFEIEGLVPPTQCSEAQIEGTAAFTSAAPKNELEDAGAFTGFNLVGKICHITASVGGNTGDFDIYANDDDILSMIQDPGNGDPVAYYISNGGELILARNEASFAAYIYAAGYAYTFKGGKLYTDIPSAQLQDACTILFDPLT